METYFLPGGRALSLPSFRVYIASGYSPSEANIEALKALGTKVPSLKLVNFDATKNNKNMMLCRGSFPVYGPNRTPFASLVEAAVNLELAASGIAPPDAPRIDATLDEFDFSSFGSGKWTIHATFAAAGKAPVTLKHEHSFPVSGTAVSGCTDVMNALVPGIAAFLSKLYSEPGFVALSQ